MVSLVLKASKRHRTHLTATNTLPLARRYAPGQHLFLFLRRWSIWPLSDSPILDVQGLRKSYGKLEVLKGVDLAVRERELVFIIGPSGSGKSTLLRCCNRL